MRRENSSDIKRKGVIKLAQKRREKEEKWVLLTESL